MSRAVSRMICLFAMSVLATLPAACATANGDGEPTPAGVQAAGAPVDDATKTEAQGLLGRHVEDGIDWAEERNIRWRLEIVGGRRVEPEGDDANRLSFETDGDVIVAISWS